MHRSHSFVFVLLCVILFQFPLINVAEAASVNHSYITDEAGVLTSSEKKKLNQEIGEQNFTLYVQLLHSTGNNSTADYTEQQYHKLGYSANDVLLVVNMDESEVQMRISTDSTVDKALLSLGAFSKNNTIGEFVEHYFYPKAGNDDFSGAIHEIVNGLTYSINQYEKRLASKLESSNAPKVETKVETKEKVVVTPEQTVSITANPEVVNSDNNSSSDLALNILLVSVGLMMLLIITAFILLLVQIVRHLNYKRLTIKLNNLLEALLVKIHDVEEGLTTTLKLSEGRTRDRIKVAESALYDVLQKSATATEEFRRIEKPALWLKKKQITYINNFIHTINEYMQLANSLEKMYQAYKEQVSAVTKEVQYKRSIFDQARLKLETIQLQHQVKLDRLVKAEQRIASFLTEVEAELAFDPMLTQEKCDQFSDVIESWCEDVNEYTSLSAITDQLPNKIQETKKNIDEIVLFEQLKLIEVSPYRHFDSMEEQLSIVPHGLQIGEMHTVRSSLDLINNLMISAMSETKRIVEARNQNKLLIGQYSLIIIQFEQEQYSIIVNQLNQMKMEYYEVHWKNTEQKLEEAIDCIEKIKRLLTDVTQLNAESEQRYFEAEKLVQECSLHVSMLQENLDFLLNIYNRLGLRVNHALVECKELKNKTAVLMKSAKKLNVHKNGFVINAQQSVLNAIQNIENTVSVSPRNLYHLNEDLAEATTFLQNLEDVIEQQYQIAWEIEQLRIQQQEQARLEREQARMLQEQHRMQREFEFTEKNEYKNKK